MNTFTHQELKDWLKYDPESGVFTWLKVSSPKSRIAIGSVAGGLMRNGYWRIKLSQKTYGAHRLAWFYVHGYWPIELIDHVNGDRGDNRIANLREATYSQNLANSPIFKSNTSGFKGVTKIKGLDRWQATCKLNGKTISLGRFDNPNAAGRAYIEFAQSVYGSFLNTSPKELHSQTYRR